MSGLVTLLMELSAKRHRKFTRFIPQPYHSSYFYVPHFSPILIQLTSWIQVIHMYLQAYSGKQCGT